MNDTNTRHSCPVCGKCVFPYDASYDICPVCGWEDDPIQEDEPDEENCANPMSLNQMRKAYKAGMTYCEARDAWLEGKLK